MSTALFYKGVMNIIYSNDNSSIIKNYLEQCCLMSIPTSTRDLYEVKVGSRALILAVKILRHQIFNIILHLPKTKDKGMTLTRVKSEYINIYSKVKKEIPILSTFPFNVHLDFFYRKMKFYSLIIIFITTLFDKSKEKKKWN